MQHSQEEERENVKINPRMARIKKRKKKGEGLKLKLRRKERERFIPSVCVLRIDSIELIPITSVLSFVNSISLKYQHHDQH